MLNRPGVQLAFVDTPGLHLGERRALNRAMNRTAAAALADADLVVFVVEALRFGEEDEAVLQRIRDSGRESIAVINKVDKVIRRRTNYCRSWPSSRRAIRFSTSCRCRRRRASTSTGSST